jgi:ADP-ribose pyrophosphatase YjhB (NUDIX family)
MAKRKSGNFGRLISIAASPVIYKDKFLLIKRIKPPYVGYWSMPGGKIDFAEEIKQTIVREIKEETGIEDVEFVDGFKEAIKYFYKKDEETVYKEAVYFLAQSMTNDVKLSFEHIGYAWASYDKAYKKLTYNNSKELLRKASGFII